MELNQIHKRGKEDNICEESIYPFLKYDDFNLITNMVYIMIYM